MSLKALRWAVFSGVLMAALATARPVVLRVSASTSSPFLWPYNEPTNVTFDPNAVFDAWQTWKAAQITSNNAGGNGRLRVLGGVNDSTTVSEGQAYGILFASIFDDQATLDGIWLFTSDHLDGHGLMDWYIGNPGQRLGTGAATDADEDMALGLVNACVKTTRGVWPASPRGIDYCARARNLIDAIYQWEIDKPGASPQGGLTNNAGNELLPGDNWNLSAEYPAGLVNLSYFAPAYYSVFGKFTNNLAAWLAVNTRNYDIVNLAQSKPGNCSHLVPNWVQYGGDPQWVSWQPVNYAWWSYDAARLAWRVAVDKRWYGTAGARETLDEIGGFFSSAGFGGIGEHAMDGRRMGSGPWPFFVATAGSAIWAADNARPVQCGAATGSLQETAQSSYNRVLSTEDRPSSYYGNAWRLFSLLLMTGNFPNLYEKAAGTTPAPPPPDPTPQPPTPNPAPPIPAPPPSVACRVSYAIVTQWNTGFQANIVIINQSSAPVAGYTLSWNFVGGETINSGWNANFSQAGSRATASNPANFWNGTIGAGGGSVTFGFIGNGTGRVPSGFALNNNACQS